MCWAEGPLCCVAVIPFPRCLHINMNETGWMIGEMKRVCGPVKMRRWECCKLKLPLLPKRAWVISFSQMVVSLLPEIADPQFSTFTLLKFSEFLSNLPQETTLRCPKQQRVVGCVQAPQLHFIRWPSGTRLKSVTIKCGGDAASVAVSLTWWKIYIFHHATSIWDTYS